VASGEWLVAGSRGADKGVGRVEMAQEQRPPSITGEA
jgi:hypothetical protein